MASLPESREQILRPGAAGPEQMGGIFFRSRLIERLDQAGQHPLIWIAAPAGSGKSTLIESYTQARNISRIDYTFDQHDKQPDRLTDHLRSAVTRCAPGFTAFPYGAPMLAEAGTFIQAHVENPAPIPRTRTVLVFDNFHLIQQAAATHHLLCQAASHLPHHLGLVILSRSEPPPCFARLRIDGEMAVLDWDDLRLTLAEAHGLAKLRGLAASASAQVERCYRHSGGWVAGYIQLLERIWLNAPEVSGEQETLPAVLDDYFACEIFAPLPDATRSLLLRASLLPSLTPMVLSKLIQLPEIEHIVAELSQKHFLLSASACRSGEYQLNPLFRIFLQRRAKHCLGVELIDWPRTIAFEQSAAGQEAEALDLLIATADWEGVDTLCAQLAPKWLARNRHCSLQQLLSKIPRAQTAMHGWLAYWLGSAKLPFDPAAARDDLETAFARFEGDQDAVGLYQCWASIVESFLHGGSVDSAQLDVWISAYAQLRQRFPLFPAIDIVIWVHCMLLIALAYRAPHGHDLLPSVERARELLQLQILEGPVRLSVNLPHCHFWRGPFQSAVEIAEYLFGKRAQPSLATCTRPVSCGACAYFYKDPHDSVTDLTLIESRLNFANTGNIHPWDFMLASVDPGIAAQRGDEADPEVELAQLRAVIRTQQMLDAAVCFYAAAPTPHGREESNHGSLPEKPEQTPPFSAASASPCLLLYFSRLDRKLEVDRELHRGLRMAHRLGDRAMKLPAYLTLARSHLARGRQAMGLRRAA